MQCNRYIHRQWVFKYFLSNEVYEGFLFVWVATPSLITSYHIFFSPTNGMYNVHIVVWFCKLCSFESTSVYFSCNKYFRTSLNVSSFHLLTFSLFVILNEINRNPNIADIFLFNNDQWGLGSSHNTAPLLSHYENNALFIDNAFIIQLNELRTTNSA